MTAPPPFISRYPPNQPPSHRAPEARKSQLLRSYVSLLQSTPLMILFQHNNLKSMEWVGVRRELHNALRKVDESFNADGRGAGALGPSISLQTIRTNIFEPALRVAEYYEPGQRRVSSAGEDASLTHALSESAYQAVSRRKGEHPLSTLLAGPIAIISFPTVSPRHVKAALQILAPHPPGFPAPTRRANPGYWDPSVQEGVKKLMLLGARVEGRVFDMEGTRWVGSIDGGIDGLRAQMVQILQMFGAGLTNVLDGAARTLYFTMEGRRNMLEDEGKEVGVKPKDVSAR